MVSLMSGSGYIYLFVLILFMEDLMRFSVILLLSGCLVCFGRLRDEFVCSVERDCWIWIFGW